MVADENYTSTIYNKMSPNIPGFDEEKEKETIQKICFLCKRGRPVFAGDDEIKGLPERALTPFLKVLKNDALNKQIYLNHLRISTKFIEACKCHCTDRNRVFVHAYCITAHVIQTRNIFCSKCDGYYQFHMRMQNVNIIGSVLFYIFAIVFVIALSTSICILDGYVKCIEEVTNHNKTFTSNVAAEMSLGNFLSNCIDVGSLYRIQGIVIPIIMWSLFYSLTNKKSKMSLNAIVEILPYNGMVTIPREKAKKNLHIIRETNIKQKIENVLFDKFWYTNRELRKRRDRIIK